MMPDPAHPFQSTQALFYRDLQQNFKLQDAQLTYAYRPQTPGHSTLKSSNVDMLLVLESTNDFVMAFDAVSGDLLDAQFFALGGDTISTPVDINPTPWGTFTVSDQLADLVQEFDIDGNFLNTLAPSGGATLVSSTIFVGMIIAPMAI